MPTPTFDVTCLKNEKITHNVYEIHFTKPADFSYEAGQFVLFEVALLEDPKDVQPRAYSIASAPHEENLIFVIKLVEGGRASKWVAESLKAGDTVPMQGPFGRFLLNESDDDLLMVCTGTGIAPFRSQLFTLIKNGSERKVSLFFGNYTEEDIFWKEELEALDGKHDWFSFQPVLSDAEGKWEGHCGFVQDCINASVEDIPHHRLYICGNPLMADAVKKMALEEWHVPKEGVHVEGFI